MFPYLIVFVGAGIGGTLRHGVNLLAARMVGTDFPYGTLTINIVGSFAMAMVVSFLAFKLELPQEAGSS